MKGKSDYILGEKTSFNTLISLSKYFLNLYTQQAQHSIADHSERWETQRDDQIVFCTTNCPEDNCEDPGALWEKRTVFTGNTL